MLKKKFNLTFGCNFNFKAALENEKYDVFKFYVIFSKEFTISRHLTFFMVLIAKEKMVKGGERKCILNVKMERKEDKRCMKVLDWVKKGFYWKSFSCQCCFDSEKQKKRSKWV